MDINEPSLSPKTTEKNYSSDTVPGVLPDFAHAQGHVLTDSVWQAPMLRVILFPVVGHQHPSCVFHSHIRVGSITPCGLARSSTLFHAFLTSPFTNLCDSLHPCFSLSAHYYEHVPTQAFSLSPSFLLCGSLSPSLRHGVHVSAHYSLHSLRVCFFVWLCVNGATSIHFRPPWIACIVRVVVFARGGDEAEVGAATTHPSHVCRCRQASRVT